MFDFYLDCHGTGRASVYVPEILICGGMSAVGEVS